jgi:AcrR family transcriptional regulator
MKPIKKLSSEERRSAIVHAVRRVFAERGFDGTTTRALADAAGVSEALLFKHFPNKEALFVAMQEACCNEQDLGRFERLAALEPSAATLVQLVHFLVALVVGGCGENDELTVTHRLLARSLVEDGEFARLLLRKVATDWVPRIEACVQAALAAGEAHAGPVTPSLGAWFTHHVAALAGLFLLPETPVVDYGPSRDQLVGQAVWFTLRGLGLKEEAIRRHHRPGTPGPAED